MPDITERTLCLWTKDCPLAGICKRIAEEPTERQAWFAPTRLGKDCPYFIPADDKAKEVKD